MQAEKSIQKQDRGAMERQRRAQMKIFYSELAFLLLPNQPIKEQLTMPILLEKAHTYVKGLKERIDALKVERERLQGFLLSSAVVKELGSFVEVNLLTGLNMSFMLHEALIILEEEGAVVLKIDYATLHDRTVYTIRSQPFSERIGIATSRVQERLTALTRSGFASSGRPVHNKLNFDGTLVSNSMAR